MLNETESMLTDPLYKSINPATDELLQTFDFFDASLLDQKLSLSIKAFSSYKNTKTDFRSEKLEIVAKDLQNNAECYGRLISSEMGKPVNQAIAEVKKCASVCTFYAENAAAFLRDRQVNVDNAKNWVSYEPEGIIFAIMPWNFPFWQVIRFAAPALMAGNTVLLKHAENVPQCAVMIEKIFNNAGFEEGVFQNLFVDHQQAAEIIANKFVKGVTLTGSEKAGSAVASVAGKNIKKTVLELGGSDPFIVLADADIEKAVDTGLKSRMMNTGQSCIAAKRFILHQDIADDFLHQISEKIKKMSIGNPLQNNVDLGPLARHDLCDKLHLQVQESVKQGTELLFGGQKKEGKGAFFEPGILINIPESAPAFNEELFGPVLSVYVVKNDKEAIELANNSPYGLGASIWSNDHERALTIGKQIETGSVFINSMVKSHPALPFGGVKNSGYGRELAEEGIRAFTNIKTYHQE